MATVEATQEQEAPVLETLEDVFSEKEPEVPTDEPQDAAPEPTPDEAQEPEEPDKPIESAKPDDGGSTSEPEETQPWHIAAVADERRKRQKAEERLGDLEGRLKELEQPPAAPENFFDDPDKALGQLRQEFDEKLTRERVELSRELMMDRFDDYEETENAFMEIVNENPVLLAELQSQRNPARFAYDYVKSQERLKEVGDLDEWRTRERAKIKAELEAELKPKPEVPATPSLAGNRSSGKQDEPVDASLEEIFGG